MRESSRERADRHRRQEQAFCTKATEKERAERMKAAYYRIFPNGCRFFMYPALSNGVWQNLDIFYDSFGMGWCYRHNGAAVGSTVSDRILREIARRQFELTMKGEPKPPRLCPSCGQETNES